MEDSEDGEMYTLKMAPSEIYTLQSILNHAMIELPEAGHAAISQNLSMRITDMIASDEFNEDLDRELNGDDESIEDLEEEVMEEEDSSAVGRGVQ